MLPLSPQQILTHYGLSPAQLAGYSTLSTVIYHAPSIVWSSVPQEMKLHIYSRLYRLAAIARNRAARVLTATERLPWNKKLGLSFITIALGAFLAFYWPIVKLEAGYWLKTTGMGIQLLFTDLTAHFSGSPSHTPQVKEQHAASAAVQVELALESTVAKEFDPLLDPTGNSITPTNKDFAVVVPSVGINSTVVPGVNPVSRAGYMEVLKKGVAHSSTSYYPNENGTVYLFSHSTNYEWFVDDLNAVFYHLKTIEPGQLVVIMYQGNRYTYQIREKKVISAREISYLVPQTGARTLILQTCWPPGTAYKRLLIFADLIDEKVYGKFKDLDEL